MIKLFGLEKIKKAAHILIFVCSVKVFTVKPLAYASMSYHSFHICRKKATAYIHIQAAAKRIILPQKKIS